MLSILRALGIGIVAFFAPRLFAAARVATLEQQIAGYKREGRRPRIEDIHRILWIAIYRWFPGHWRGLLRFVSPETVIRWHKRGFRAFWR